MLFLYTWNPKNSNNDTSKRLLAACGSGKCCLGTSPQHLKEPKRHGEHANFQSFRILDDVQNWYRDKTAFVA